MKYLKKFNTEIEYTDFAESDKYILPNVSFITNGENVMFNPAPVGPVYKMVDLGLPSGLKWADRNIGATSPEDYGLYFQWGDTVGGTYEQIGKDKVFNYNSYSSTTNNDTASVIMGSNGRMPSVADFEELFNNTTAVYIDLQGSEFSLSEAQSGSISMGNLKGVRFIGSNGNSIFIPAAGNALMSNKTNVGIKAMVWSSDLYSNSNAYNCCIQYDGTHVTDFVARYSGQSVRGVCNK